MKYTAPGDSSDGVPLLGDASRSISIFWVTNFWFEEAKFTLMIARTIDWFMRRPQTSDRILAVALMAVSFAINFGPKTTTAKSAIDPGTWWHWLILSLPGAAVAYRRLKPELALIGGTLATMAIWSVGLSDSTLAGSVLLYSAVLYGSTRFGRPLAISAALAVTLFTLLGVLVADVPPYALLIVALITSISVVFGIMTLTRQEYLAELERKALATVARRRSEERRAVAEERNRIARELHDVVAHGLSVIVVHAGGGQRIIDSDPNGARQSLQHIERAARSSLLEMRQVLGLLRTPESDSRRPAASVTGLPELVSTYQTNGLKTTLETRGQPRELASTISSSVYRIVEEALTNVLKHGGPLASAAVIISYDQDNLVITVSDDGRGAAALATENGHGLLGMSERVELLHGSLMTGPTAGGGFQVRAKIPISNSALVSDTSVTENADSVEAASSLEVAESLETASYLEVAEH